MSTNKLLQIREFDRENDIELVSDWYRAHGTMPVPIQLLPKLGIIVFDGKNGKNLAALWLDMSNNIGVCYLERAVTAPGLALELTKEAVAFGITYLKRLMASEDFNYALMLVRTSAPIARILRGMGFHDEGATAHCLVCATKEAS